MTNLLQALMFIGKMVNTKYLCNLLNTKISYLRQNLDVLIDSRVIVNEKVQRDQLFPILTCTCKFSFLKLSS